VPGDEHHQGLGLRCGAVASSSLRARHGRRSAATPVTRPPAAPGGTCRPRPGGGRAGQPKRRAPAPGRGQAEASPGRGGQQGEGEARVGITVVPGWRPQRCAGAGAVSRVSTGAGAPGRCDPAPSPAGPRLRRPRYGGEPGGVGAPTTPSPPIKPTGRRRWSTTCAAAGRGPAGRAGPHSYRTSSHGASPTSGPASVAPETPSPAPLAPRRCRRRSGARQRHLEAALVTQAGEEGHPQGAPYRSPAKSSRCTSRARPPPRGRPGADVGHPAAARLRAAGEHGVDPSGGTASPKAGRRWPWDSEGLPRPSPATTGPAPRGAAQGGGGGGQVAGGHHARMRVEESGASPPTSGATSAAKPWASPSSAREATLPVR